jgi:hypothetical protein
MWGTFGWASGEIYHSGNGMLMHNTPLATIHHWVKATLRSSTAEGGVCFRGTGTATDTYLNMLFYNGTVLVCQKFDNDSWVSTYGTQSATFAQGDVLAVTVVGESPYLTVRVFKNPSNSSPVSAEHWDSGDTPVWVASNINPYPGGESGRYYVGVGSDTGTEYYDNFSAGDITPWDIGADQYSESGVVGSVCWGHSTGVTQDNTRTFASNWTGTGDVENSGDSERIVLTSGQYMISEVVNIGAITVVLTPNAYQSGDSFTVEYRQGATSVACEADSWHSYTGPFSCDGYVQVRVSK